MYSTPLMAALINVVLFTGAAVAQDVRISTFMPDVTFTLNDESVTIQRNQDTAAVLQGDFTLTSRPCPPACIQPMIAAPGVATVGELELIGFLETVVSNSQGLLLDVRDPTDFAAGSVPGAVNVPVQTLGPENRFRDDILRALGAVDAPDSGLDFSNAMTLALFSGGVWSPDAPSAIKNLIDAGYPASKLLYFRGGMQAWVHVGLTVQ